MIVNVSPTETDLDETLCSLKFAQKARGTSLGKPVSNMTTAVTDAAS